MDGWISPDTMFIGADWGGGSIWGNPGPPLRPGSSRRQCRCGTHLRIHPLCRLGLLHMDAHRPTTNVTRPHMENRMTCAPRQQYVESIDVPLWAPLYGASASDAVIRFFTKYATF
jgi:hypothetical protein